MKSVICLRTMKIISLAIMGAALALISYGCSSPQNPEATANTSGSPSNAGDWSYTPPEGFEEQKQQDRGDTVFNGPKEDGFQTNLRVKGGTNDRQTSEQIGKDILKKILNQPNTTLKEEEPYTLADSDCYTWMVSRKGKSGKIAEQRQFIVSKKGIVVLFTLTAPESTMSKWDQALADSLKTFHWGRSQ